jgi:hypothetical protein
MPPDRKTAEKPEEKSAESPKLPTPRVSSWIGPVLLGWIVPGGGHFLLRRRGRGLLLLVAITVMFLFGLAMRGTMFKPESGDLLTTLINYGGFVGDLASGSLYMLAGMLGYDQPDMPGDVHDYGTKFLVTAGLLNILAMVDAFEIAAKRKE